MWISRPKTLSTKISLKVQEYRPPPLYLGNIPKKTTFFTASLKMFVAKQSESILAADLTNISKYVRIWNAPGVSGNSFSQIYGPLDLRAFFQQGYWPWRFPLQGALYQASVSFLPSSASHSCEVPSPPSLAIMPPCQCQICLESTMEVFYGSWRLSAMWSRMSAILETEKSRNVF